MNCEEKGVWTNIYQLVLFLIILKKKCLSMLLTSALPVGLFKEMTKIKLLKLLNDYNNLSWLEQTSFYQISKYFTIFISKTCKSVNVSSFHI